MIPARRDAVQNERDWVVRLLDACLYLSTGCTRDQDADAAAAKRDIDASEPCAGICCTDAHGGIRLEPRTGADQTWRWTATLAGAIAIVVLCGSVTPVTAASGLPHDLSPWGMFLSADIVVKTVMVGLAIASVAVWVIWLAKVIEIKIACRRLDAGISRLDDANKLLAVQSSAGSSSGFSGRLVQKAADERIAVFPDAGYADRVIIASRDLQRKAQQRARAGLGLLATIGATAPFIGLFGTVWGIMNAFVGIARTQTTSLAVVAPGIAEALLATAIGLVAAIPAVIAYNHLSRLLADHRRRLEATVGALLRLISREAATHHFEGQIDGQRFAAE